MISILESKKNHHWRKTVWHTDPDLHPLGPTHSVEVYCCEEANGYSVWYIRRLGQDDQRGLPTVENGDYLLKFYPKSARDTAIEHAVLVANSDADVDQTIVKLDTLAAASEKI